MATGFKVTAAVAVLPTEDGSVRYVYRSGAVLPAKGFTAKGLKHALENGLIEKAELVDVEAEAAAEAERAAAEKAKAEEAQKAAEAQRVANEKAAAEKAEADKKAAEEAAAKEAAAAAKPGARGNAQAGK